MSKEQMVELIELSYEQDTLWYMLGGLISAENFVGDSIDVENTCISTKEFLELMILSIDDTKLSLELKEKVRKMANNGLTIVGQEMERLKNG